MGALRDASAPRHDWFQWNWRASFKHIKISVRKYNVVVAKSAVLASLQPTCCTRAFRTVPPQELTDAAHKAARLTDTDAHIQTASRAYTRPFWYQSRVWDPDD